MAEDELGHEPTTQAERRALFAVLLLNIGLASGLAVGGWLWSSSALIANALDNASDAAVYAISLYAVTRGAHWKLRAAQLSGVMLLAVAGLVVVDVVRRFTQGSEPVGSAIIGTALAAMLVNLLCLRILAQHRDRDVALRSTWAFSINDFVSNLGAVLSGALVLWLGDSWPDLVVGIIVALVVGKGAVAILLDVRRTRAEQRG